MPPKTKRTSVTTSPSSSRPKNAAEALFGGCQWEYIPDSGDGVPPGARIRARGKVNFVAEDDDDVIAATAMADESVATGRTRACAGGMPPETEVKIVVCAAVEQFEAAIAVMRIPQRARMPAGAAAEALERAVAPIYTSFYLRAVATTVTRKWWARFFATVVVFVWRSGTADNIFDCYEALGTVIQALREIVSVSLNRGILSTTACRSAIGTSTLSPDHAARISAVLAAPGLLRERVANIAVLVAASAASTRIFSRDAVRNPEAFARAVAAAAAAARTAPVAEMSAARFAAPRSHDSIHAAVVAAVAAATKTVGTELASQIASIAAAPAPIAAAEAAVVRSGADRVAFAALVLALTAAGISDAACAVAAAALLDGNLPSRAAPALGHVAPSVTYAEHAAAAACAAANDVLSAAAALSAILDGYESPPASTEFHGGRFAALAAAIAAAGPSKNALRK